MKFTKNWHNQLRPNIEKLYPYLPGKEGSRKFLEIGSFEGASTCMFLAAWVAVGDILYAVDTWSGSAEHEFMEIDWDDVQERFDNNTDQIWKDVTGQDSTEQVLIKNKLKSLDFFARAILEELKFDFIYIDGSHTSKDVMTDACIAWELLNEGGIILFDDYLWQVEDFIFTEKPKYAIDNFLTMIDRKYKLLSVGYQLAVKKI